MEARQADLDGTANGCPSLPGNEHRSPHWIDPSLLIGEGGRRFILFPGLTPSEDDARPNESFVTNFEFSVITAMGAYVWGKSPRSGWSAA